MRPKQQTLAATGFERHRKRTRREQFLADMNQVVPWNSLVDLIAPVYPKGEDAGRPPMGLERMLRIHCLCHLLGQHVKPTHPIAQRPMEFDRDHEVRL